MSAVEERVVDRQVLTLLRAFLRAGVMEQGAVRRRSPAPRRAGWSPRCSATSTCTGSTGHGRSATWSVGPLRRRSGGDVPDAGGGRGGACGAAAMLADWAFRRSRPRPGSCTCGREARGSTSSVSTTAGCAPAVARHVSFLARWPSRQGCSMPATTFGCDRSPSAVRPSRKSSGRSTCSCVAGRDTSDTGTPPALRRDQRLCAERLALFLTKRHARAGRRASVPPSSRPTALA